MLHEMKEVHFEKRKAIAARPKGDFVLFLLENGDEREGYVTGRRSKVHAFGYNYRDNWQLTDDINEALSFSSRTEADGMLEEIFGSVKFAGSGNFQTNEGSNGRIFTRRERGGNPLSFILGDVVFLASDLDRKTPMTVCEIKRRNRILDTMEMEDGEDIAVVTWFRSSSDMATAEIPLKCISL